MKPTLRCAIITLLVADAGLAAGTTESPSRKDNSTGIALSTPSAKQVVRTIGGTEDWPLQIRLGGGCERQPMASQSAVVMSLPSAGVLLQFDGTPITNAPAEVTDASKRLTYVPAPDSSGQGVASFTYQIECAASGEGARLIDVSINLTATADPPVAISPDVEFVEDTPKLLQLTGFDPDIETSGDALTTKILFPISPNFGQLYQVLDDDSSFGPAISVPETAVTNPRGYVWFVPQNNYFGNGANFIWRVEDQQGQSDTRYTTLFGENVNDPPTVNSGSILRYDNPDPTPHSLQIWDIDTPPVNLTLTVQSLPTNGLLYFDSVDAENLVTEPGTQFSWGYSNTFWYVPIDPVPAFPFDSFTYTASDGEFETGIATYTWNVGQINAPPQVNPIAPITILEDGGIYEIMFTVSDPDSPPDSDYVSIVGLADHGVVEVQNALQTGWFWVTSPGTSMFDFGTSYRIRYTPHPGANTQGGPPDQITVIPRTYESGNDGAPYTIDISISAVNDPPLITAPSDASARLTIPGLQRIPAVITTISVVDDAGPNLINVRLTATNAQSLTLLNTEGLVNFRQLDAVSIHFDGTPDAINAALGQGIEYMPSLWGLGEITVLVNDRGMSGDEQPPVQLTSSVSITVTTTP